jgi:hypothetical protein
LIIPGLPVIKFKASIYGKIGMSFLLSFSALLLGCGIKLVMQSLFWLKNGHWERYSIRDMLRDLDVGLPTAPNFLGVQEIIDDIASWPALVGVAVIAVLCLVIGSFFVATGERYDWEVQKQVDAAAEPDREPVQERRRETAVERTRTPS